MKKQNIIASLSLLILTVIIVGAAIGTSTKKVAMTDTSDTSTSMAKTATTTPAVDTTTPNTSMYKNGSYTGSGMYNSPGGEETFTATLTLSNGKVVKASYKSGSNESISAGYQQDFIDGSPKYVIGKAIDQIKVSKVAGSSLTSIGFNEALQTIEQQAHV